MQLRPDKTWPDEQTRRALIYVVVMCATIVAGLGAAVYGSDASFSEPQTMRDYFWIIPIDGLPLDQAKAHPVARWLVILGEPLVFASVVLVLGFIALLQRDRRLAFIAIAGPISAEILTEIILKPVVGTRSWHLLRVPEWSRHSSGIADGRIRFDVAPQLETYRLLDCRSVYCHLHSGVGGRRNYLAYARHD